MTFVNHRCTGGFTYFALHFIHATFCIEPRKLSFTTTGKGYNFQTDYTAYVMIVASSQWGTITNYANNNVITVTIPANVK